MIALKSSVPTSFLSARAAAVAPFGRRPLNLIQNTPSEPNHSGTEEGVLSHDPNTVKFLRTATASALSREPAKIIALRLGVSHRQVENLRAGLTLPHVPLFLEIAKRDPALRAQVIAILSGEGEAAAPERINEIIRFMEGR